MSIGKSKISDIDFSSMESNINKSMELTDATENFDGQVNALHSAKSSLDESTKALIEAKADMNTARLRLDNAATNVNAAADTISGKVDEIKKSRIAVEVDPNDWQRLTKVSKTIIDGENGALEKHRIELSNKLESHYYNMCNQLGRNEGVWISGKLWTYVMWFSIACYAYTFISLSIMFASLLRSRPPLPSRSMTLRSWLSGTT